MDDQQTRAQRFRALHQPGDPLILVNAWDALSARIVAAAGARAVATTSAAVAWSRGAPDGDVLARDTAVDVIRRVADAVRVPVTADIESGYGDSPAEVAETIIAVLAAGAVGVNVEDSRHDGGGPLRPAPCPAGYPGGPAGAAVKFACAQIGKIYVWGAAGPDHFDCSGLTMAAWAKGGVSLPHSARQQHGVTKRISRAELRAGDLVFYYGDLHHVAMYVGDGWVVHASQSGKPITMKRVDDGDINSYGRPG